YALLGIEAGALVEILVIGHDLVRNDANSGAIGRRFGASATADVHAAAGAVLDHDRLTPALGQLLADRAHENVADATGRGRCDDPDRLGGVVLRQRNDRPREIAISK